MFQIGTCSIHSFAQEAGDVPPSAVGRNRPISCMDLLHDFDVKATGSQFNTAEIAIEYQPIFL
jgi:hypothetical protein